MRKPKRYDKNYTQAENRQILDLKDQGWSALAIARKMGRTKIGISRHLHELSKNYKPVFSTELYDEHPVSINIMNVMKDICEQTAPISMPVWKRRPNKVWFYNDTDKKTGGYAFKVPGGAKWSPKTWAMCRKAVLSLGYCKECDICDDINYETGTLAYTRGIRVFV